MIAMKASPWERVWERLSTIEVVRVPAPPKLRIAKSLIEQRGEVGMELGTQKVTIGRAPLERRSQNSRQLAFTLRSMRGAEITPGASGDRQTAQDGDRLEQRGLAGAIFPHEERYRRAEAQIEGLHKWQIERKGPLRRQTLRDYGHTCEIRS